MEFFFGTSYSPLLRQAICLVGVGILWGCTNPLMKKGSEGVTRLPRKSKWFLVHLLKEFVFLFTRWQYVLPLLLNFCGSILFFKTLGDADISLVVPIANSLTFIFTTLTGKLLGETGINTETYLGMLFVLIGVSTCVSSKANST